MSPTEELPIVMPFPLIPSFSPKEYQKTIAHSPIYSPTNTVFVQREGQNRLRGPVFAFHQEGEALVFEGVVLRVVLDLMVDSPGGS